MAPIKERRPGEVLGSLLVVIIVLTSLPSLTLMTGCAPKKADWKKVSKKLNDTSYKVQVYQNGKKQWIWAQTPEDYFKSEDPKTKKVVIYHGPEKKLLDVVAANGAATEIPLETINNFTKFAPQTIWDDYSKIPWVSESNKKWKATKDQVEYTAFFEAEKDLLSKIVVQPSKETGLVIEFKYSMIEEVPLTEYQLPSEQAPGGAPSDVPPHN